VPGLPPRVYAYVYRKYVRKWWLLKRNRIICPKVAVNKQFLPGNRNFSKICLKKSKFFKNLPGKIDFFKNCLKKSKFLGNLPGKIESLLTRINDPSDFKPD